MTLPRMRAKPRRKLTDRVICPAHLRWVAKHHCSIEGRVCKSTGQAHECWGPIDPHHVKTRGAGGGDEQVVSLCRGAHSLLDSPNWSSKRFEEEYEINMAALAAEFWDKSKPARAYEARQKMRG